MAEYKYKLPDVGEGVVEAEIVEWHIKEGDSVTEDQHILDVMTDKATVEIPCAVNGVVKKIVGAPGDVLPVGTEILVIEIDGTPPTEDEAPAPEVKEEAKAPEKAEAPASSFETASSKPPQDEGRDAKKAPHAEERSVSKHEGRATAPARSAGERALASPAVRKRALDADIDLAAVPGTGPAGRITHADLDDFIAAGGRLVSKVGGSASGPSRVPRMGVKEEKVIGLRRKIAQNMAAAKRTIPHITYVDEIDLTALEDLRAHLNANRKDGQPKLTLIPFLVAAMTRALPQFPQANAHFDTEESVLTKYEGVHCGIATATPNGLMVPVIRHADRKGLWQIAQDIADLAASAQARKLGPDAIGGASMTISNLGGIGGVGFTPIVNPPELAILGLTRAETVPVFEGDSWVPVPMVPLDLSYDHRVINGADAARFLRHHARLIEDPRRLLI